VYAAQPIYSVPNAAGEPPQGSHYAAPTSFVNMHSPYANDNMQQPPQPWQPQPFANYPPSYTNATLKDERQN
jgi:hypothetical protein